MNTVSAESRLPHTDRMHEHASAIRGENTTRKSVTIAVITRIRTFHLRHLRHSRHSRHLRLYSYRNASMGSSCDARRAG